METPLFSVLVAVAFVTGFYDIAMVRQAVKQGGGHFGIAKHLRPFSKAQVGGHNRDVRSYNMLIKWNNIFFLSENVRFRTCMFTCVRK